MLRPEVSLPVALATGAVVYGIYSTSLPTAAEARVTLPGNTSLEAARRAATWKAAAVVAGISLLAADPSIFIIGGAMVAVEDWTHRHANAVNPKTGKLVASGEGSATAAYPANGASVTSGAGAQGQ